MSDGPILAGGAAIAAESALLVPMRLQALPVAEDSDPDNWTDLTPRYRELTATRPLTLGRDLRPSPFTDPVEAQPAGIHLHWTLPAAFTRIEQKQGKSGSLPAVPNRWLVMRLWEEPVGELRSRLRFVESDYLGANGTSPWLSLVSRPGEYNARDRIGRAVTAYAAPASNIELTAAAPGNLAFAGFYPSCRNVFGYCDRPTDVQQPAVLSYFVVGWFSDPRRDPLADCKTGDDWLARMGGHGWTVPPGIKALPTRILCHAAICGVSWPPSERDIVGNFPDFELAVGGSAIEAIAALVKTRSAAQPHPRERLLDQLQFALLQNRPPTAGELNEPAFKEDRGGLSALRASLHATTFAALPGGTRWEIDRPRGNGSAAAPANPPLLNLSPELAAALRQINRQQRDYDLKQRELAAIQRELFFQWYKTRLMTQTTSSLELERREARKDALKPAIASAAPEIDKLKGVVGQLKGAIEATANQIRGVFATDPQWGGHVLAERPMPRYWRPNDPTVLMAGVPIPAIQDGKTLLLCRVSGQTVSSLSPTEAVADFGHFDVKADDLKNQAAVTELAAKLPPGVATAAVDLLCEGLLLDPQRVGWLTRLAYRKQHDSDTDRLEELAPRLRDAFGYSRVPFRHSAQNFTIGDQRANGQAAATAFDAALSATVFGSSPWKPVFMIWQARYLPTTVPSGLADWDLDRDGIDYVWRGSAPPAAEQWQERDYVDYSGYSPLGDSVGRGLSTQEPRPQHRADIERYLSGSLVVQSIGGFSEALLLHDTALQLPPLQEGSRAIDGELRDLVSDHYDIAPLAELLERDAFQPIRAGHLVLHRVWLVDTFGRVRRVVEDGKGAISISRSLAVPDRPQQIRLAPRLAQPSRLLFRWQSAEEDQQEFLGDAATQPICGWVIRNRLDHSLLICDAAGKPLGAVQLVAQPGGFDGRGIRWVSMPLEPIAPGAIANRHLRGFVQGLLALADDSGRARTGAFDAFLKLIERIERLEPRPPERQGLSVLVGRPLALARASLRLDLLGPPALDHSWSQLDPAAPKPAAFTEVPFAVRLGNRRKGPDGLIGYFPSDQYAQVHLAHGLVSDATGNEYYRLNQPLLATCNPKSPAALLTLLLDPRLPVHIDSGILPTKLIDLPAELVSEALSRLEVPFLVAPVLGESLPDGAPNIPLPGDLPGEWIWAWRPAFEAAAASVEIKSDTAPARSLFKTMALYEGWLALRRN